MPRSSHLARGAGATALVAGVAISLAGCALPGVVPPLWEEAVTLSRVDLDRLTPVA